MCHGWRSAEVALHHSGAHLCVQMADPSDKTAVSLLQDTDSGRRQGLSCLWQKPKNSFFHQGVPVSCGDLYTGVSVLSLPLFCVGWRRLKLCQQGRRNYESIHKITAAKSDR